MENLQEFEGFRSKIQEKEEKWIKGAIEKPGALRRQLGKKEGEKITKGEIEGEIKKLRKEDTEPGKKGIQGLSKPKLKKLRRLNLAKTLGELGEGYEMEGEMEGEIEMEAPETTSKDHKEFENYMFFQNMMAIKNMANEICRMDKGEIDRVLSNGHDWALDHTSTSKDDVEEVYHFLKGKTEIPC